MMLPILLLKNTKYVFFCCLLTGCVYTQGLSAAYTSSSSGNWHTPGTWTCTTGPCGSFPGANDIVIINTPVTLNTAISGTLNGITINSGGSLTLGVNLNSNIVLAGGSISTSGTGTRTLSGTVTVSSSSSSVNNSITPATAATLYITGNLIVATGTVNYSGGQMSAAALTVQSNGVLNVGTATANSGTLTVRSNATMNGRLNIRKGGTLDATGSNLTINANENGNPTCDAANSHVLVDGVLLVDNLSIEASCLFVSGVSTITPSSPPGFVQVQQNLTITERGDMQIAGLYLVGGNVSALQGNIDITGTGYFGVAGTATYQNNGGPEASLNYCNSSAILTCSSASSCPFPSSQNSTNECSNVCRAYFCSGFATSFPLPVDLISFSAAEESSLRYVQLEWITASEQNNDYFVIERSKNAHIFAELETIQGAGNYNSTRTYKAFDKNPLPGINYYRLKQVDQDGKFAYSKIVSIRIDTHGFEILPNPTDGKRFTILWRAPVTKASIFIYNQIGHQLYSQEIDAGNSQVNVIFLKEALKKGIYLVKVQTSGQQFIEKLFVHE
jgi:hypothetical protein